MDHPNFEDLFKKYLDNLCSAEEAEIVLCWLESGAHDQKQKDLINQVLSSHPHISQNFSIALQKKLQNNFESILHKIEMKENTGARIRRFSWIRYAAAAVLILIVGGGILLQQWKNSSKIVLVTDQKELSTNDLAPGGNKAILTLADGKQIVLDETKNGDLTRQGNTKIIKLDGKLAYNKVGNSSEILYNTIATPKGGQYQLILTDGTKVWLNAASSLRFPTSFQGKERKVEITGEGYFEVAKNPAKPFIVSINNANGKIGEVEVLGTHFNINAYKDEPDVKATLLEGSVKVKMDNAVQMLVPGQQANLQPGKIALEKNVDISQVVAWKEGFFLFDNTDLQSLMRQVARWYNVEVSFTGKVKEDGFSGKINRDVPLSKFLKVLEMNDVHVKVEGQKIIVGH